MLMDIQKTLLRRTEFGISEYDLHKCELHTTTAEKQGINSEELRYHLGPVDEQVNPSLVSSAVTLKSFDNSPCNCNENTNSSERCNENEKTCNPNEQSPRRRDKKALFLKGTKESLVEIWHPW